MRAARRTRISSSPGWPGRRNVTRPKAGSTWRGHRAECANGFRAARRAAAAQGDGAHFRRPGVDPGRDDVDGRRRRCVPRFARRSKQGEEARALASRRADGIRRPGPGSARHGRGVGGDRAHHRDAAAGPSVFGPDIRHVLFTLNDAQKEKYLFPVLRGEKTTAFAQSEPDAGSDPGAMRTTAVRQGDHYVINGIQALDHRSAPTPISSSLSPRPTARKGSRGGLSMFLVDADTPGVKVVRKNADHDGRRAVRDRARRREGAGREHDRQGRRRHEAGAEVDHRAAGSIRPAVASAWPSAASI